MPALRFCNIGLNDKNNIFPLWSIKNIRISKKTECTGNIPLRTLLNHPVVKGKYQPVYDSKKPDIVFLDLGYGFQNSYCYYRLALAARRRFGWSPALIAPYYEDVQLANLIYVDKTFSSQPPTSKNVALGIGVPWVLFLNRKECQRFPKSEFCNYIYSNDAIPSTAVRRAFCKLLMSYKRIDCPARSLNNGLSKFTIGEHSDWYSKIPFMKHYKFTIAFEHNSSSGYVTEKIIQSLDAGSVPIYWGSPKIANYLNPDAFINCHDYQNFDQVVERVIELDKDPDLYARYVNAPPTVPGNYYHDLLTKIRSEWSTIIAEVLARRHRKRTWFYTHARLGLMMLNNLHHEAAQLQRVPIPNFKMMLKKILPQE